MDTPAEVERIRALWEVWANGSEWLENPDALKAAGAEVGTLLRIIDRQQAVIEAAGGGGGYRLAQDALMEDGRLG